MELFVNILTLTACFSAMAYCYILAKRIHAFHNIKDGVGALIEEMIRTTTDLQTAFNVTQNNIDNQYHKLQDKIDEGVALTDYLSTLLQEIEQSAYDLQALKTELSFNQQAQKQSYNQPKSQKIPLSTLPDDFRLHTHSDMLLSDTQENNISSEDPLADIMPADFDSLKRKKRHQIIIKGEEYL